MFNKFMDNAKKMVNNAKDGFDTSAKLREKQKEIENQKEIISNNMSAMGEFIIRDIESKFDDLYKMTHEELQTNIDKIVGENADPYYKDLVISIFDAKRRNSDLEKEFQKIKNEAELKKQEIMNDLNTNKDEAVDYLKQTFTSKDNKNKEKEKQIVEQYLNGDITIEELRFLMKNLED